MSIASYICHKFFRDNLKNLILLLFLIAINLFAQDVKFFGEAAPGNIMLGYAENITRITLNGKKILFDKDGHFVFGFDRDAKGKYVLRVKQKRLKEKIFTYKIEQREYEKQKLSIASKFVSPPKRFLKQIERETVKMKAARKKIGIVDTAFYKDGFIYPVDSVRITGDFGNKRVLNGKPKSVHNGIDFGGDEGDSIYAITNGIVRLASENFYFNGTFILIDHGQGLSSVYLHLSKLHVKTNDRVVKGQFIGEMGATGRATGPHLHLGVQWLNKRIDPLSLLNLKNLPSNEPSDKF